MNKILFETLRAVAIMLTLILAIYTVVQFDADSYWMEHLVPVLVLGTLFYIVGVWFIHTSKENGERTYFRAINEGMLDEEIKYLTRDQRLNLLNYS